MTSPSPMKSPDRDAADELVDLAEKALARLRGLPSDQANWLCVEKLSTGIIQQASELATLRRRVEWQPMKTAPKDGTRVLLDGPGSVFIGAWLVEIGWHQTTGWVECGHDSPYIEASVKAWQPLPSPLPPGRNEG